MKIIVAVTILLLVATLGHAQNTTYTVTGLNKISAAINDIITVSGNFTGASASNVKCQFTVQPVNSTFSTTGSAATYTSSPQIVSTTLVTCPIGFTSTVNSLVYVNIISVTSTAPVVVGTYYFVYIDSSIVLINEQFSSLTTVDCGSALPSSAGCPSTLTVSSGLYAGQDFTASTTVTRNVIHSTKSAAGQYKENSVDFNLDAASTGNG
jgi:hypothetical protein